MKQTGVSYGQLDRVLRSFGFARRPSKREPPGWIYEHKQSGAMLMLPRFADDEIVFEHHLVAAQAELDNFGIADPHVFTATLQKAG